MRIQTLKIYDLEAPRASDAHLRLEVMDGRRFDRYIKLLKHLKRIIATLQQFSKRRLAATPNVLINRFQGFEGAGKLTGFDYADKDFAQAVSRLEEGSMRRDTLRTFQSSNWVVGVQSIKRERDHLTLCRDVNVSGKLSEMITHLKERSEVDSPLERRLELLPTVQEPSLVPC